MRDFNWNGFDVVAVEAGRMAVLDPDGVAYAEICVTGLGGQDLRSFAAPGRRGV